jgi:serine/threonine-protein kinase
MTLLATPSLAPLLRRLQDDGLLSPGQLAELWQQLGDRAQDPQHLGRELLRRGWLTAFQVNQVQLGRSPVLGRYTLLGRLGSGSMGEVYRARHRHMGRLAAIKLFHPQRLAGRGAAQFLREVEAAARLDHPHVVHAYDADAAGGRPFLAMELVEGPALSQLVAAGGPLPVVAACDYVRQAALGLQHAHERGVVHRDVKPSHLLLQARQGRVKVTDFGLARLHDAWAGPSGLTRPGRVVGTLDYLAPEQIESGAVDGRADLYGLGCAFYFLLAGRPPFPGGSAAQKLRWRLAQEPRPLRELRADVPAAVAAVVHRLLAKRPGDRYQTAGELAAVLASAAPPGASQSAGRLVAGWFPPDSPTAERGVRALD